MQKQRKDKNLFVKMDGINLSSCQYKKSIH